MPIRRGALVLLALAGCMPEESTDPPGNTRLRPLAADAGADGAVPDAARAEDAAGDALVSDAQAPDALVPDAGPESVARPRECGDAVLGVVGPDGGALRVEGGALLDAAVVVAPGTFDREVTLRLACAGDIARADHVALGAALAVLPEGGAVAPAKPLRVTLAFSGPDRPSEVGANDLRLFWKPARHDGVSEPPVIDAAIDLRAGTFAFTTPDLGTFQIGHRPDAGRPVERRFTYRAIGGVSMGAGAAAYLGSRYSDRFDFVLPLGGASDWAYLLNYIRTRLLGGFCAGEAVGTWCGLPPPDQQFELEADARRWPFSDSGGRFDRSEYVKLLQDISYAYGNPLLYNPVSAYRPPGYPASELRRPAAERCRAECRGDGCPPDAADATFRIAEGFFDGEYNPDGHLPVIAFCDGEDGDPPGHFDDGVPHVEPVEVLYAVDVNGNGRRDRDEPILRQTSEPYDDVGCDGVSSRDEPGYDPVARPDPANDDYDWYRNPLGTEGNWRRDDCGPGGAEPFRDTGLDGVAGTPQLDGGGFDFGEGNGRFDANPNYARFLERNPGSLFRALPAGERARVRFWVDAGIRDVFNFATAGDHLAGQLQAAGENVRIYDDHAKLLPPENDRPVYFPDPARPDPFGDRGRHVFVRYGDPDAGDHALAEGDGAHVGTPTQALNRFMTMLDWVLRRWPGGDYAPVPPPFEREDRVVFFDSPRFGKRYRYGISLPPGYGRAENAGRRYPLLLILHGYGQGPEDLPVTGALLAGQMASGAWQKAIIAYPEGFCGDASVTQCNDGVDNDGDGAVDAGRDAAMRTACAGDRDCRGDYRCRAGWCCPAGLTDCGPPDPECGRSPGARSEGGGWVPLCADGVDNDRDGRTDLADEGCLDDPAQDTEEDCKQGSFFTTHPARKDGEPGGPDFEGALLDMLEHIDANFRTKRPETLSVPR